MEPENDADPFDSLIPLCHVSDSQEEHLRRCRFAGEPDPGAGSETGKSVLNQVRSPRFIMVSPPESSEHKSDSNRLDVCCTPPKESPLSGCEEQGSMARVSKTVAAGSKGKILGSFSELRSAGKRGGDIVTVCSKKVFVEFPLKKSKISEKNSVVESRRGCTGNQSGEEVMDGTKSGDGFGEVRLEKTAGDLQKLRVLPQSIVGEKEKAVEEKYKEVALVDILKILKEVGKKSNDEDSDDDLNKEGLYEIAKRRGMTFPTPEWWDDSDFV